MKTLAERLRFAMDNATPKKIKGVDLARVVGVKPPSVSDWLSGKSKTMEGENLLRAAKYLGINALWLATGHGEMKASASLKDEEKRSTDIDTRILISKSPRSQALELLITMLDEMEQKQIITDEEIKLLQQTATVLTKSKGR